MKIYFLFILILFKLISVYSQNMEMIEMNENNTATLNFSDNVDFVIFGNNPQTGENRGMPLYKYYELFTKERTVVIRAKDSIVPITSITVRLVNGDVWFGKVKYGRNTKIFYDFNTQTKKNIEQEFVKKEDSLKNLLYDNRIKDLLKLKVDYVDIGSKENNMVFVVTNMRNDDKHTYIKIIVDNDSGNEFIIDDIIFKYVEGKSKGLKKEDKIIEERLNVIASNNISIIKAYQKEVLAYVIPLFNISEKGRLLITLIEKNGTRRAKLEIQSEELQKIKLL